MQAIRTICIAFYAIGWLLAVPGLYAQTPQWPHTINGPNASVVIYQPQAVDWPDHRTLLARAAIAITPHGEAKPILGTVEVSFATATDAASNQVVLSDTRLVSSHFPSLDTARAAQFEDRIKQALPSITVKQVPLPAILLSLKQQASSQAAHLQDTPPVIFHSSGPAALVVFDGDPVLAPVGKSGLSFAVNTNWDVLSDGKDWYLLDNGLWLSAPAYQGPYRPVSRLPASFNAIPPDQSFAEVRKAIPPTAKTPAVVPKIFVSTKPAEIIVTQGEPAFVPIAGTDLQAVKNTTSTLILQPSSGKFFLLVSGRWFASQGLDGPWSFATNELPASFAAIPANGPQASVLASVPGTGQAQLAVLQAEVPRQATLKKTTPPPHVVYAGAPQFRSIPGTEVSHAVNTSFEVMETGGRYYLCYQGAWFVGASPSGPWTLADAIPAAIYAIPPDSPLYNTTFVKVYASDPTSVTYGYTAGYAMSFVYAGVVVYGTGYYYPPVVIPGPVPIYYPYPYSYAGNVWYNSATGAWAQRGAVYGPYGGVGAFSYYNPTTGAYAHGSAAWGPNGGVASASYYNPRTGISGSTQQNWNAYSRWGSSTISGPSQTVHTASASNAQGSAGAFKSTTGAEGAGYRSASGNSGGAVKTQNGDVYAGRDGNVYQHTSDGWSKWNDGSWQPMTPPASAQANRPLPSPNGNPRTPPVAGATQFRQPIDSGAFSQLEQDRTARFSSTAARGSIARFRR